MTRYPTRRPSLVARAYAVARFAVRRWYRRLGDLL